MANINAYLRRDGRWEVRIYSTYNNGKRRYKSVYGQTKEETERKAMYIFNSTVISRHLTKITVKELVIEYIQRKAPLLKGSTVANYRMKAEKHIIPALGELVCTEISANDIYRFMEEKRRQKLSERYIYDILVLLKSVFRYANNTYGVRNIMSGIVMPKHSKPDVAVLNSNDQKRLISFSVVLLIYQKADQSSDCHIRQKEYQLLHLLFSVISKLFPLLTAVGSG